MFNKPLKKIFSSKINFHRLRNGSWTRSVTSILAPHTSNKQRQTAGLHTDTPLPTDAQIVICGGGVIGCSVAYHLAKLVGWKDIVLLEQGSLSCGTTWHAAGLIGKLRPTIIETQLSNYGVQLYNTLEEETGLATGYKACGGLYLAKTKDRMTLMKRRLSIARLSGVTNVELITPREIQDLWPLELRIDDLQGALWVPDEGSANPTDITQSLARGATMNGVKIFEKVEVNSVVTDGSMVRGVTTNKGDINCKIFVNCAGQWSRQVGQTSNPKVNVPLHSCEHFYIVTKAITGVHTMMPNIRDPDGSTYYREWSGGLMAGGFEPRSKPCFYDGIPQKFEFQLLPEDWEQFGVIMEQLLHRVPSLKDAEIRQMVNGPESFTPDNKYIVGEAPEVRNYYVGAGMCSSGVGFGAGLGKALSEWITAGRPTMDLWPIDIKRFSPHANNKQFLRERVKETLGWIFTFRPPYGEANSARRVKCSPLYTQLSSAGAVWGEKMGWERTNYFDVGEQVVNSNEAFGRQSFTHYVKDEAKASVENVAVIDMTSTGMFQLSSTDESSVEQFLQTLCCNDVNVPVGTIVHTAMLNEHGCYEMECTVTRTNNNRYLVEVPTSFTTVARSWILRHIPDGSSVSLLDMESACVLGVLGPKSEELLQSLTQTALHQEEFPLNTHKTIDLGFASDVKALRNSNTVDQGWQLIIDNQFAVCLYNQLMEAGKPLGIRNAGYYALDSLRTMNGQPRMGVELGPFVNPFQAGLDDRIDINKEGDFIGKKALLELKEQPIKKRLISINLEKYDDNCIPWGGEPILRDGKSIGVTSSATISYLKDTPVCMGYVTNDVGNVSDEFIQNGRFEINVAGDLFPAKVDLL